MEARFYEETKLEYQSTKKALNVTLPWLWGTLDSRRFNDSELLTLSDESQNTLFKKHKFADAEILKLPFIYLLPREELKTLPGRREVVVPENINDQLKQSGISFSNLLLANEFSWSIDEVLKLASLNDEYFDPLTIYTAVRRFRNKQSILSDNYSTTLNKKLTELQTENEKKLFQLIRILLMQSYYVTSRSQITLTPAIKKIPEIAGNIENYIQEENGHHNLIRKSLTYLDTKDNPSLYTFFSETIAAMTLFQYCAKTHPVAFCCMLAAFEAASDYDSDPIADILSKTSKPKAANGLIQHFNINKTGNHAEIGLKFILDLKPCDRNGLIAAVKYSELLNRICEGIAMRALTCFNNK